MLRLAHVGVFSAIGALVMGIVGIFLVWLGEAGITASILLIPGAVLLVSAGFPLVRALRGAPASWRTHYAAVARAYRILAVLAATLSLTAAIVAGVRGVSSSVPQLILLTIVALQGPASLGLSAYMLRSNAAHPDGPDAPRPTTP